KTHVVALKRVGAKARHLDAPLALTVDGAYGATPFALDATIDSLAKLADGDPVGFSLNANAFDVALKLNGKLTGPAARPEYEVQIALSADALTKVESALGASLPLTGPIKVAAQVKGSPTKAVISGLDLKIGASDLGGTIAADLGGRRPAVAADLKATKVDLASFQPAARSGAAKPAPAKAAAKDRVFSNDPIDVSALNALDAKIGIAIDELVVGPGAVVRAVSLKLDLANGIATLKPLAASVAGSQLVGEATIDARKAVFDVALGLKAPKVDLGQAMAFAGSPGLVEGKGDVAIDLKTRGSSLAQLMGGLDGTVRAMTGEGRLKTTLIDDLVGGASAIIGTLVAGKRDATALTCAAVSFDLKKGVATAKALLIDTEFSTVAGEGSADLGAETLDLKVSPKPKGVTLNVAVPIKIKGAFANPSVGPDELAAARKIGGLIGAFAFPPAALLGLARSAATTISA
ncbi:MAG: AsmA family protein, partial [Alphaproteobacteria bacterium]|nr:AsmA family protein [Alphaproteobacteria bacterium]